MRVKLGRRIRFCTTATNSNNSDLILLTTGNGVYTVKMNSVEEAKKVHMLLLTNGWYDFSDYDYSN